MQRVRQQTMRYIFTCVTVASAIAGKATHGESPRAEEVTPVPTAVKGIRVRVVSNFATGEQEPVRIAAHQVTGRLYVLGGGGDVSLIDAERGTKKRVLAGKDYIEQPTRQDVNIPLPIDRSLVNSPVTLRATLCLGLTFDRQGRLYIVANVQMPEKLYINRVAIYRTPPVGEKAVPGPIMVRRVTSRRPAVWAKCRIRTYPAVQAFPAVNSQPASYASTLSRASRRPRSTRGATGIPSGSTGTTAEG